MLQTAVEFSKNIYRRKQALMVVRYFVIVLPLVFHTAVMAWFDLYKAKRYTGLSKKNVILKILIIGD